MTQEVQNKTFFVDLPSEGRAYDKTSPLSEGSVELRYGNSGDENILLNQHYIARGEVFDRLLEALLVNKSINIGDLLTGDKNALVVATRQAMYGNKYPIKLKCPHCGEEINDVFDLSNLHKFKFPSIEEEPEFNPKAITYTTEAGNTWGFRLLTEADMKDLAQTAKKMKKLNISRDGQVTATARTERQLLFVNDIQDVNQTIEFFRGISSIESQELRNAMLDMTPDIDLSVDFACDNAMCNYSDFINIELNSDFFWPTNRARTKRSRRSV